MHLPVVGGIVKGIGGLAKKPRNESDHGTYVPTAAQRTSFKPAPEIVTPPPPRRISIVPAPTVEPRHDNINSVYRQTSSSEESTTAQATKPPPTRVQSTVRHSAQDRANTAPNTQQCTTILDLNAQSAVVYSKLPPPLPPRVTNASSNLPECSLALMIVEDPPALPPRMHLAENPPLPPRSYKNVNTALTVELQEGNKNTVPLVKHKPVKPPHLAATSAARSPKSDEPSLPLTQVPSISSTASTVSSRYSVGSTINNSPASSTSSFDSPLSKAINQNINSRQVSLVAELMKNFEATRETSQPHPNRPLRATT